MTGMRELLIKKNGCSYTVSTNVTTSGLSIVTHSSTCPSQIHHMRERTACVDFINVKKTKQNSGTQVRTV